MEVVSGGLRNVLKTFQGISRYSRGFQKANEGFLSRRFKPFQIVQWDFMECGSYFRRIKDASKEISGMFQWQGCTCKMIFQKISITRFKNLNPKQHPVQKVSICFIEFQESS